MCDGNLNLDGIRVFAGEWYGVCILCMYCPLTDLPRNTSLTVIWISTAIGLECGIDEGMLMGGMLSIVCGGG
jgi:hypothetical protein